ncbi:uncharacterized protein LOC134565055 isoform X2 [Prinia subflava]
MTSRQAHRCDPKLPFRFIILVLFFRPGPKMLSLPTVLFLTKLLTFTQAWTVPQSRANVWALLAESMGQDHICLNQASVSDPMSTCLMGIPFRQWEMPERLLHCAHCISKTPQFNPFIGWKNFVLSLPDMKEEPRELRLLGATTAPACIRITNSADTLDNRTKHAFQSKVLDRAHSWCKKLAKGVLPPQIHNHPQKLPEGVFLICRDRAWAGIPSRLSGGPCTLGKVGLFTPNKMQITDWKEKQKKQSGAHGLAVSKRDLRKLDPDCDSEIIHWNKTKEVAITNFAPWVSFAKAVGELGHLKCWVAKQANLTSKTLFNLLEDEEIMRQASLQNLAAIDYIILLHDHMYEEFEGLCCFNLSTRAESTRKLIVQMQNMISDIKRETGDWMSNIFKGWGLSGWDGSILKTCLLTLFIILIVCLAFGLIRRSLIKLVLSSTSTPSPAAARVAKATAPEDELKELEKELEEESDGESLADD